MKVLIVGADGFLGKTLFREFQKDGNFLIRGTSKSPKRDLNLLKLDLLTNPSKVYQNLQEYDAFFFLPGMTKTLDINQNPSRAKEINFTQSLRWIEFLSKKGSRIIFPSSSAVYGNLIPYPSEIDAANPNSYYGELKLLLEQAIIDSGMESLIIRLTKVVSRSQPLFLNWQAALLREESISAFCDSFISPIHINQAAEVLKTLATQKLSDPIVNISGGENLTYFSYAIQFASLLGADIELVKKKKSDSNLVTQSSFASLNVRIAIDKLGFVPPSAMDTLKKMMGEFLE